MSARSDLAPRQTSVFAKRYGPWAVVTGASDGIGRAIAARLAADGVNLVLVARRGPALRALADSLSSARAIDTRVVETDLARPEAAGALDAATADLDVGLLVAAAGFGTAGPLVEAQLPAELEMIDVNCRAVVELSVLFGRRFVRRGRGGVVLMSSLLAFQGVPRAANYAATKAFVQVFAEGLRRELAPLGVDVLASAPGPVRTGFADRADMQMSMADRPETVARLTLDALGRRTTVRPGPLALALEAALVLLPRTVRTRIMALVMADMTKHRAASTPAASLHAPGGEEASG